jgi:lipoyl(octanoyl) transferase
MKTNARQSVTLHTTGPGPLAAFHLLGVVDIQSAIALQTRLVYEASGRDDDRLEVLLVEHLPAITIGRAGSRAHIRLSPVQLASEQLDVQWVGRGGGAVLHQPGQLAVYPIVPVARRGWSVGEYMARFRRGISDALATLQIRVRVNEQRPGLWGRTGQLVSFGVGVRNWITQHGAWVNIDVPPKWLSQVAASPPESMGPRSKATMSSLLAERQGPVTMSQVRSALVTELATAFDCPRQHVHSGHPLFRPALRDARV